MIAPFYMPIKIIFGPGGLNQLGDEARAVGRKALIATYPDIKKVGVLDKVVADLKSKNVGVVVFDQLEPNPRTSTIDQAADIARKEKIDLVIGLGGGSAMDASKGIALAASGTASIWDYVTGKTKISGKVPALIQVPTLAGTGSELNQIAVFTDWQSHEKRVIIDPNLWARAAIIDPEVTLTVPKKLTASGGLDAFSHIVETYLTLETSSPINDAIREAVMKTVINFLPRALENLSDIEPRVQLSWAATIASSQLSRLGGGVGGSMTCHGIEHGLSGYYDVNHGAGLAALMPSWMRQFQSKRKFRFELLGANVFGKVDAIPAFEEWLEKVGLKLRLRDLGCKLEDADKIAELALKVWDFTPHPTPMGVREIAAIYREAF